MKKNLFLIMFCLLTTSSLLAQEGVKNYANIKVSNGAYLVANDNMNFTNAATGTLEVSGAARLEGTANANLAANNAITVVNGANLLQNSDNVGASVKREIRADTYHLLSNPVNALNIESILTGAYAYEYIENSTASNNAWLNITSGQMYTDRGYLVENKISDRTVSFAGKLNNGTMSYPLEYTAALGAGAGYNLVGNPYSCALDWTSATGFDKSNISGSIWIWDNAADQYGTSNGTVATFPMTSNIIPATQGFFVKAMSAASFAINNNAKVIDVTTPFYKKSGKSEIADLLRIRLSGNNKIDECVVYFDDNATANYDLGSDADKFKGTATNLFTLSADNYPLAINTIADEPQSIPLHFTTDVEGEFTLRVNEYTFTNAIIYMEDITTGNMELLGANTEYKFTYKAGDAEERFILHLNQTPTAIDEFANESNIKIFAAQGKLNVQNAENGKIQVFDLIGKQIFSAKAKSNVEQIELPKGAIYIVRTIKNNQIRTKKIKL